jgi:hypothetical protein
MSKKPSPLLPWVKGSSLLMIVLLLALLLPLLNPEPAKASGRIVQLTDNNYPDNCTDISGGQVVWSSWDGSSVEIYLYDGDRTVQITDDNYGGYCPRIDDGMITWGGWDGDSYEIFLYDGAAIIQLTNDGSQTWRSGALVDSGQVTWEYNGSLFLYTYADHSTIRIGNCTSSWPPPDIDSGQVTWEYNGGLFLYTYADHSTIQIGNGTSLYSLQIDSGQVVWQDGNRMFLYTYADGNTLEMAGGGHDIWLPMVDTIDAGQVVWGETDYTGIGDPWALFLYTYGDNSTVQLGSGTRMLSSPRIDRGQVTWGAWDGNDCEVFLYTHADHSTLQLTNNGRSDEEPMIDDGHVVWFSWGADWGDVNQQEIFLYQPDHAGEVGTATGTGSASFDSVPGIMGDLTVVSDASLPSEGKPALLFPHGLFEFDITGLTPGESVTLTVTLPSAVPTTASYWKYGPTPSDSNPHWYQIPLGDNDGDNVITITLRDGGLGDDDLSANGIIVDQGGPGWPGPSGPGGGGHSAPVFPSIYIGIGAALGAGILAYILGRKLRAGY